MTDCLQDFMVLNEAHTGIACRNDRTVRQFCRQSGAITEASVLAVVQNNAAVLVDLPQPLTVGTDPQVSFAVGKQAADPDPLQLCGEFIFHIELQGTVYDIQSVVCSDIIIPMPFGNRVDDLVLQPKGGIDISERRGRKTKESEAGGGEPQIALVILQHVVNGIVEIIDIDEVQVSVAVQISDSVFG